MLADDRVQLLEVDYDADQADRADWWATDHDDETCWQLPALFEHTATLAGPSPRWLRPTGRPPAPT